MQRNYRILVDPQPLIFTVGFFEQDKWQAVFECDSMDEALDWIEWTKKIDDREKVVMQTSISGNEKFYFKH
jgi:hypothetical protein